MAAKDYNFLFCPYNRSQGAAVSSPSELSGGEAANLVAFDDSSDPWVTENAGPFATEFLVNHARAATTRALALAGGSMPVHASRFRAVRGWCLEPMVVHWKSILAETNRTGSATRLDPRSSDNANSFGPSTVDTDWSVTLDFAEPEFGWAEKEYQKLVVVFHCSTDGGDPTFKVEVKNSGGTFVEVGSGTVSHERDVSTGDFPRFSWRLPSDSLQSTAEVRISGTFVTTGDLHLHHIGIVGPVDPANDILRPDVSQAAIVDSLVSKPIGLAGVLANYKDESLVDDDVTQNYVQIAATGQLRLACHIPPAAVTAGTVKFNYVASSSTSTDLRVRLYATGSDGVSTQLGDDISTVTVSDTSTHAYSVAINANAITDIGNLADGTRLEIDLTNVNAATATISVTGLCILVTTYASTSTNDTHDSGWTNLPLNAGSSEISGGDPIDLVGRAPEVAFSYDFRSSGKSIEVRGAQTFIDLEVVRDPDDANEVLSVPNQIARTISFRHFFEGPGFADMKLPKGSLNVGWEDTSQILDTLGGRTIATDRRVFRRVSFTLRRLDEDRAPLELGAALQRIGQTEPVLFIVLPEKADFSSMYSLLGKVNRDPTASHQFGTKTTGSVSLREF